MEAIMLGILAMVLVFSLNTISTQLERINASIMEFTKYCKTKDKP
jgi:hypothetical protein